MTQPKPPMPMSALGPKIGIPKGKKFSILNLVRAAAGSAKKRRPKPGQDVSATYSY